MKVVVTGGAGFIGARTVRDLLGRGHAVTVVDNFDPYYPVAQKRANLAPFVDHPAFTLLAADVLEVDVDHLLGSCDAVLHLAGQPGVRPSWTSFDAYLRGNVATTQRLLEGLRRSPEPPRFVVASSSSVYGAFSGPSTPVDAPLSPTSPYGVTKLAAESLALAYARTFGLPVVALRYFTVYGPGQRPDMAFFRLLQAAVGGGEFEMLGDGSQIRDFTFVDDVAQANIAALVRGLEPGTVLNVGGGQPTSLSAVVDFVNELCPGFTVTRRPKADGDVPRTGADLSRTRELLGWQPSTDWRTGLEQQLRWQMAQRSRPPQWKRRLGPGAAGSRARRAGTVDAPVPAT